MRPSPTETSTDRHREALESFAREGRPTLIIVDRHIGYGAPNRHDTSDAHGEPLGEDDVRVTKRSYGWPEDAKFLVPDGVGEHFAPGSGDGGSELREAWYAAASRLSRRVSRTRGPVRPVDHRQLPEGWDAGLPGFPADAKGMATRDAGGKVLNALATHGPLAHWRLSRPRPSTKTRLTFEGAGDLEPTDRGPQLHFGVREHAMGASSTAWRCEVRAFGSLSSSSPTTRTGDPARGPDGAAGHLRFHARFDRRRRRRADAPADRAHLALRAIPGLDPLRPADANEVTEAWRGIVDAPAHTGRPR